MDVDYIENEEEGELLRNLQNISKGSYQECNKYDFFFEKELNHSSSEEELEDSLKEKKKKDITELKNSTTKIDKKEKDENQKKKNNIESIRSAILGTSNSNIKEKHQKQRDFQGKRSNSMNSQLKSVVNNNKKVMIHLNAKKRRVMVNSDESDCNEDYSVKSVLKDVKKRKEQRKS